MQCQRLKNTIPVLLAITCITSGQPAKPQDCGKSTTAYTLTLSNRPQPYVIYLPTPELQGQTVPAIPSATAPSRNSPGSGANGVETYTFTVTGPVPAISRVPNALPTSVAILSAPISRSTETPSPSPEIFIQNSTPRLTRSTTQAIVGIVTGALIPSLTTIQTPALATPVISPSSSNDLKVSTGPAPLPLPPTTSSEIAVHTSGMGIATSTPHLPTTILGTPSTRSNANSVPSSTTSDHQRTTANAQAPPANDAKRLTYGFATFLLPMLALVV